MKLYFEDDNGNKIELKELSGVNSESNCIIFLLEKQLQSDLHNAMTEMLKRKTGKEVILLSNVTKVYGV